MLSGSARGWVIQDRDSGLYVMVRQRIGVYVRKPDRATIFETRRQAARMCETRGEFVRPASDAFALPGTTDYVQVPPMA